MTIAGMFPKNYDLKVVDMNIEPLTDAHLEWADVALTSTMIVQKDSLYDVAERCNRVGVPIIAGGPHPTSYYDNIMEETDAVIDHFLFGEVEEIFEDFLTDFVSGCAQEIYCEQRKPDITMTPPPRYDLIDINSYGSMALQFRVGVLSIASFATLRSCSDACHARKTMSRCLLSLNFSINSVGKVSYLSLMTTLSVTSAMQCVYFLL